MSGDVIRRTGIARAIGAFILVAAVLPGVTYVGHWQGQAPHTHEETAQSEHDKGSSEEHVLHCHTGPSSCAGAQALVGAIWVGEDPGLITPASETRTARESTDLITPEAPVLRILEPPRAS